ncbi:MAG: hypothetical protein H0U70_05850 [Tatlockia sp.]|nr:hypothetical protein [Tatlockia sp.]
MSVDNSKAIKTIFWSFQNKFRAGYFYDQLINYRDSLLQEEAFLKDYSSAEPSKSHPLRCAQALKDCFEDYEKMKGNQGHCFYEKLANFEKLANNTGFYPNTRIAGQIIAAALIIFAFTLLLGIFINPFASPILLVVIAAIVPFCTFPLYSMFIGKAVSNYYQPIFNVERQGSSFFSEFKMREGNDELLDRELDEVYNYEENSHVSELEFMHPL